ncbi:hypothetical protein RSAG8_12116, partial [Rhizoctonia solani AG-8 WAC10335]
MCIPPFINYTSSLDLASFVRTSSAVPFDVHPTNLIFTTTSLPCTSTRPTMGHYSVDKDKSVP